MTPTRQSVIKIIPTKQLKATTVTMTMSLFGSLLFTVRVALVVVALVVVSDQLQLDSSGDGIDKGHNGDDMIENVLLCKDIPRGLNIFKYSRKAVVFVCIVAITLATYTILLLL